MGYFPVDEETCNYMRLTGRTDEQIAAFRNYFQAQGLFGMPKKGDLDYTTVLELDLPTVRASVAGPKRPQDRIEITELKQAFINELQAAPPGGYGKPASEIERAVRTTVGVSARRDGHRRRRAGDGDARRTRTTRGTRASETEIEMMNNRPTPDRVASDALADEFPTRRRRTCTTATC